MLLYHFLTANMIGAIINPKRKMSRIIMLNVFPPVPVALCFTEQRKMKEKGGSS